VGKKINNKISKILAVVTCNTKKASHRKGARLIIAV